MGRLDSAGLPAEVERSPGAGSGGMRSVVVRIIGESAARVDHRLRSELQRGFGCAVRVAAATTVGGRLARLSCQATDTADVSVWFVVVCARGGEPKSRG